MHYTNDTRERLAIVANAVGWDDPNDYSVAEKDQQNALVRDLDREVELYPVVHAWSTDNGSGLKFWCKYCNTHHVHGRHGGPGAVDAYNRRDAEDNWVARLDAVLPLRLWRRYLQRFGRCKFNDRFPGGLGVCTCPVGSGDGHRVAHCGNRENGYYEHGYILHEVEPNDARATRKPSRRREP